MLAQTYGLETDTWPVIPLILHPVKLPPRLVMLTAPDATGPGQRFPQELVERAQQEGHQVTFGTMLFHQEKLFGEGPAQWVANFLRAFCQGVADAVHPTVCVEILLMAGNAGLVAEGEAVVVVAGTGRGADTALGQGINSWWTVDAFARTLAGPAWRDGLVSDELIHKWAHSSDRWWRRAALVSTVALNVRSRGGRGDVPRTLQVCRLLADDHDDMVAKAMSWALRELVVHDAQAVRDFMAGHDETLAARVKREVRNKLATGLKNPHRGQEAE